MYNQFDRFVLNNTKNIKYLSAPKGYATPPKGIWTAAGYIGSDALLVKDDTTIRIPINDITRVAIYDLNFVDEQLHAYDIDMIKYLNSVHGWQPDKLKSLFLRHQLPLYAKDELHRDNVAKLAVEYISTNGEEL